MTSTESATSGHSGSPPHVRASFDLPVKPKGEKKLAGTEYVVLRQGGGGDLTAWTQEQIVRATSSTDAVRKGADGKEGTYVAVPARSFQPVKVKVETTTRLKLEDA